LRIKAVSDIKLLENKSSLTPDELILIRLKGVVETKIQQYCNNLTNQLSLVLERKYGKKLIEFVQFDNGDTSVDKLKKQQVRALFGRKKREGSKKGFPDGGIFIGSPCSQYSKIILVEFKRMGSPSQMQISPEQKYYHDWLNSIGFEAHITNNPIYFRDTILKSVKDFFS
jgi:hypothetical protein